MGKLLDRCWGFVEDYPLLAAILFLIVLSVLMFLNVAFWAYPIPTVGCPNPSVWGCIEDASLNLHGTSWANHIFFTICAIEIFFILFCTLIKREKDQSSWDYTLQNKLYALGIWVLTYFVLIPLMWLFSVIPYYTILVWVGRFFLVIGVIALCIIGIAIFIGLFYLINVGLSKVFEREK